MGPAPTPTSWTTRETWSPRPRAKAWTACKARSPLGADLENLTLSGAAAIDATGNALDNVLTGNTAANTLDGGAGNDTLNGGFGADTYLFGRGDGQDLIQESDDGTDATDCGEATAWPLTGGGLAALLTKLPDVLEACGSSEPSPVLP